MLMRDLQSAQTYTGALVLIRMQLWCEVFSNRSYEVVRTLVAATAANVLQPTLAYQTTCPCLTVCAHNVPDCSRVMSEDKVEYWLEARDLAGAKGFHVCDEHAM